MRTPSCPLHQDLGPFLQILPSSFLSAFGIAYCLRLDPPAPNSTLDGAGGTSSGPQGRLGIIQTPAIDEKRKLDQGAKCSSHLIHASLGVLGPLLSGALPASLSDVLRRWHLGCLSTDREAPQHQTGIWGEDSQLGEELAEASKSPDLERCRPIIQQGIQARKCPNTRTRDHFSLRIRNKAEGQLHQ